MMKVLREESMLRRTARDPRVNAEDGRDAVRPRAMQQVDVDNNQSSAELGGDRNRDQSGFGNLQEEDHAVPASHVRKV